MNKLKWLLVFIIWLSALLGGCSKIAEDKGNADQGLKEAVPLRYMIWDKNQETVYKEIAARFMKNNPNITIDIQVVPWSSYWEKLMTDIAGGSAPDVFWGYMSQLPSLVEREALLPIGQLAERDGLDLTSVNTALLQAFTYKGERYGIPKDWETPGLFYNKRLLKNNGYDAFPQGLTWNPTDGGTLVPFLQSLTLDQAGKHPNEVGFDPDHIRQYGFNYTDRGDWDPSDLLGFVASDGGRILQDGQFLPEAHLLETIQFMHDLIFKYHVSPAYTVVKTVGSDRMFFSSQTALWLSGPRQMIPIKDKARFEWGIQPFPAGPDNRRVVWLNGVADHISVQTTHPDESWKFVSFINGKEAQDILGETGTILPVNNGSITKFIDYYKEIGIDPTVFVQQLEGPNVTPPVINNYMKWLEVWNTNMGLIFSGELDLNAGLAKIADKGHEIINKGK